MIELDFSGKRKRLATQALQDTFWDWDLVTDHLEFGPNIAKYGFDRSQPEPHISWWERQIHPDDREAAISAARCAIASGERHFAIEYRFCKADGEFTYIYDRGFIMHDENGRPVRAMGAMVDTTELRSVKDVLRHTKNELAMMYRLNAMGTMGSMIAHELSQPLTAAANFIRASRRLSDQNDPDKSDDLKAVLEGAEANVIRAGDIIRRLRELVTRGFVASRATSLDQIFHDACTIILDDPDLRQKTRIKIEPADLYVWADAIQIQQVIVNLVRNAIEAMADTPDPSIMIDAVAKDRIVEISVRDNGPGIPDAIQSGIFSAVMTSKETGMGIGLSISRTIIDAQGGTIWLAKSVPGHTEFKFTLPLSDPAKAGQTG